MENGGSRLLEAHRGVSGVRTNAADKEAVQQRNLQIREVHRACTPKGGARASCGELCSFAPKTAAERRAKNVARNDMGAAASSKGC